MRRGYFIALIFVGLILALVGTTFFNPAGPADNGATEPPPGRNDDNNPPEPEIRTAALAAVGDIMGHLTQVEQARTTSADGRTVYDFRPSFDFIAPYLMEPDITVGNLETTLAGPERGYSGYPNFNTPVEMAANLKEVGFDLLATANNHSLDMGLSGLKTTVENIRAAGLKGFGTYLAPEERQQPLIVDVNGIRIAFTAYTKTTNGIPVPQGHGYAVKYIDNFYDPSAMLDEVAKARKAGADVVAVYIHWGFEYNFYPADYQRELAQRLADAGADLILGSHPHVIQPLEWVTVREGERAGKRALAAYSMGNFISNQYHWPPYIPTPAVQYGLLVNVELEKNMESGETVIADAGYEITWVYREWRHRILPVQEVLNRGPGEYNLTQAQFQTLQEGLAWMKGIVETYNFSAKK